METNELHDQPQPEAHRVDEGHETDEKDLKRPLNFGAKTEPVKEGQAMGGHKFGEENHPPTGDDKNNPSQNAGYTNPYFARTKPSEEYPQDNNFKAPGQEGEPNYEQALPVNPAEHLNSHQDNAGPGDNAE